MSKINVNYNREFCKNEEYERIYVGDYVLLQVQEKEPDLYICDYNNKMRLATDLTVGLKLNKDIVYVNDTVYDEIKREIKVLGICDISINIYKVKKYK